MPKPQGLPPQAPTGGVAKNQPVSSRTAPGTTSGNQGPIGGKGGATQMIGKQTSTRGGKKQGK